MADEGFAGWLLSELLVWMLQEMTQWLLQKMAILLFPFTGLYIVGNKIFCLLYTIVSSEKKLCIISKIHDTDAKI